jgi:hypothetical protein
MRNKYSADSKQIPIELPFSEATILASGSHEVNKWTLIQNPGFYLQLVIPKDGLQEIGIYLHNGEGLSAYSVLVNKDLADGVLDYLQSEYQKVYPNPLERNTTYPERWGELESTIIDAIDKKPLIHIQNLQVNGSANNYFVLTPMQDTIDLREFYDTIDKPLNKR